MRLLFRALLPSLLLAACPGKAAATDAFVEEVVPPWVAELRGDYTLWQDGEAGLGQLCDIILGVDRTIGGYAVSTDGKCEEQLQLAGEPAAWFLREDGYLILIDAARQALLTMQRLPDGGWKDSRNGDYVDAVLLDPRSP